MLLIPIESDTLALVTALNDNVEPPISDVKTYLMWRADGNQHHTKVVTAQEAREMLDPGDSEMLLYKPRG